MVKLKTQQTRHVAGEFDAITCLDGRLVVHDARMHPDMVKLLLGPTESASANHCLVVDQRWGPQVLMEPQHYTSIEHLKFAGVEIYLFQDGFNPIILPSLNHSLHHRSLVFPSFQVYEPPRLRLRRHLWGVGQQRGGLRGHGAAAGAGRAGGEAGDGDDVARLWLGCGGWDGDGEKLYINYIYHFWGGMKIHFPSIVHQGTKGCDLLRCESEMLLPVGIVGVWVDLEPHFISNII